ncbi:MAG: 1,4-alpha-glucan branching protein GlgB [Deltaproteobacteria bacterium]|nr:MAG: 1,4-alpha-glucan branching protein GlgB [Deltaproteobacteria bacterium]
MSDAPRPITSEDLHFFNEGTHRRLWEVLGAHPDGQGCRFAVWAPAAASVHVAGDFNGWDHAASPLSPLGVSGIWVGYVPGATVGQCYKYRIATAGGEVLEKADPVAFATEVPPRTASVIHRHRYAWGDGKWLEARARRNPWREPMSIYELHLGSWMRDEGRMLDYRTLAGRIAEHVRRLGFTHVELLPVMEHPFYGSWGYQTTGYFAPTARYGSPEDFAAFVDHLHREGIGVVLDWVPSHFPSDPHGLARFDGTHLYEHADPRLGFHPDWHSSIFNYGRHEVRAFLISSALFWVEVFHADALRVDAVASMLYRDYSRAEGEWVPNEYGGRENLEAVRFLQELNTALHAEYPGVTTIAEESTAWPGVTRPVDAGGLGFGFKWDMGWMHDTLAYLARDPVHRAHHHDEITFRSVYAFTENFVLPLSHDEVVHAKGSLLDKMPGDRWQRFANLRLLYAYMWTQPGKKLLFMGSELAMHGDWNHESGLPWELLDQPEHRGVADLLSDLNRLYRANPALWRDHDPESFAWVSGDDANQSVLVYLRLGAGGEVLLVALNFTPVPRTGYRVGVPEAGRWREILNTDAPVYGGSGLGNLGGVEAEAVPCHGHAHSLSLTLPPLAAVIFEPAR